MCALGLNEPFAGVQAGFAMIDALMNRLLSLKVARDRKGMAPNKPLLVLAILDLVEAGLVGMDGLVHKDAQLNLRFRSYSSLPNDGVLL